jgi:hypothetical protein
MPAGSIVALFDMTGYSVRDWALVGETCYCLDMYNDGRQEQFPSGGSITYLYWEALDPTALGQIAALKPKFLFAFPPCTDLAVSGAAHFESKRAENPSFQDEALYLALIAPSLGKRLGIPWFVENPVGTLSTLWGKPDHIFEPWEFGGYLPASDTHPKWPEYIEARDAYPKTTCIWSGNGLKWPERRPVEQTCIVSKNGKKWSKQQANLGGKSLRTKQIRSATPRGFARAIFEANYASQQPR